MYALQVGVGGEERVEGRTEPWQSGRQVLAHRGMWTPGVERLNYTKKISYHNQCSQRLILRGVIFKQTRNSSDSKDQSLSWLVEDDRINPVFNNVQVVLRKFIAVPQYSCKRPHVILNELFIILPDLVVTIFLVHIEQNAKL